MVSRLPRWSVKDLLWITALVAGNCLAVKLALASLADSWFGFVIGLTIGVLLWYGFLSLLRTFAARRVGTPQYSCNSYVGFVASTAALTVSLAFISLFSTGGSGALAVSIGSLLFAVRHGEVLVGPNGLVAGWGMIPWHATSLLESAGPGRPRLRIGKKWQMQSVELTPELAQFAIEHGAATEDAEVQNA